MKNNDITIEEPGEAQLQPEMKQRETLKKYFLFIGDDIHGFVHACSEVEALDRVAVFKKPFRAMLFDEVE
ncbi:MAG: hypothetical protein WCT12_23790 [Verrucomicrobiota bacterium]|jgi:hypothetical protein